MAKSRKIILFSIGGLVAALVLIAAALKFYVDANISRPRLQAAASEALGMQVSIGGHIGVSFFSGVLLTMNDVRISNGDKEFIVAEEVRITLEPGPLLQNEIRISNISLQSPKITVELGADGNYNFENPQASETTLPAVQLARLSLSDGTFLYTNKGSGGGISAEDCNMNLFDLLLAKTGSDILKRLAFTAELRCGKVRTKDHLGSGLKLSVDAKGGVFTFKPITLELFGGQGSGSMLADYSGKIPHYRVSFTLPQFRVEKLLAAKSSETIVAGAMDLSMNLALQGVNARQMKRSAAGDVALVGKGLKLNGHDLDLEFSRFASSQNFSLLDVGALFIAGPVGMAVTKGYDFANVLKGSGGGVSTIRTFVSRWKVKGGVMYAQDVAMATSKHRMALLGALDMANKRFVDVILALIDNKGCAVVQQKISGPFEKPVVEQPSIIGSVAGPVLKLLKKGRKLLPGGGCEVIYSGSVAAPR